MTDDRVQSTEYRVQWKDERAKMNQGSTPEGVEVKGLKSKCSPLLSPPETGGVPVGGGGG